MVQENNPVIAALLGNLSVAKKDLATLERNNARMFTEIIDAHDKLDSYGVPREFMGRPMTLWARVHMLIHSRKITNEDKPDTEGQSGPSPS